MSVIMTQSDLEIVTEQKPRVFAAGRTRRNLWNRSASDPLRKQTAFPPKVVIPYHYRGSDLTVFQKRFEKSATTTASLGLTPVWSAAYCPQCREGHPHATLRDTAPLHAAGRCKNQGKPGAARRCQEGRRSRKRKDTLLVLDTGKGRRCSGLGFSQ